jgi:hypothetical protein
VRAALLASLGLLGLALPASAHPMGVSYLRLAVAQRQVAIDLELGIGDAALALGLPAPEPSVLPEVAREAQWQQLAPRAAELGARVREALGFWQDGAPCALDPAHAAVERAGEADFVRLRLRARCPGEIAVLGFRWDLPFAHDPLHRALVSLESEAGTQAAILSARRPRMDLPLRAPEPAAGFALWFGEGVRHIASGADHLLFLVALLLPAPLFFDGSRWAPRASRARVALEVVQTVTAFTLAHSLTLAASALGAVRLPGAAVEAAIAASVALAALNAIRPFLPGRAWHLAFGFGLLHGLGFARFLTELGLPSGARLRALLAFNLGVEAGQLVVVTACLPLLLWLGGRPAYRRGVLVPASAAIAALASLWVVERLAAL